MALEITRDARGFLQVKTITMSFRDTTARYWYYDTERWLVSTHGKYGDTPDRPLHADEIEQVRKHYLPKLAAN